MPLSSSSLSFDSGLLAAVRRLSLTADKLTRGSFIGLYRSRFRGHGLEFEEVRDYQLGDDLRAIDWRVTARKGAPYTRTYSEERNLDLLLAVDVSGSMQLGAARPTKKEIAVELTALLALIAEKAGDRLSLLLWSGDKELFVPFRKGLQHTLSIIYQVIHHSASDRHTDFFVILNHLRTHCRKQQRVFILSDFLCEPPRLSELLKSTQHHDISAVRIHEPLETHLPDCGLLLVEDPESHRLQMIDSSSSSLRENLLQRSNGHWLKWSSLFNRAQISTLSLSTAMDPAVALEKFLKNGSFRKQRSKQGPSNG